MAIHQPSAANYFLRAKNQANLTTIISKFWPDSEVCSLITSDKVDILQFSMFIREINRCFSDFHNKYMPFKAPVLEFEPEFTPFDIATVASRKMYEIFKNLKAYMYFPKLDKNPPLLELAKITDDLIECINMYLTDAK